MSKNESGDEKLKLKVWTTLTLLKKLILHEFVLNKLSVYD